MIRPESVAQLVADGEEHQRELVLELGRIDPELQARFEAFAQLREQPWAQDLAAAVATEAIAVDDERRRTVLELEQLIAAATADPAWEDFDQDAIREHAQKLQAAVGDLVTRTQRGLQELASHEARTVLRAHEEET